MKRKAPLRTILGQSEIPSGEWTISRPSAKQAQAISPALRPQRVNSRPFRIYEIGHDRLKRYLQALLTKSEIELKLSQCKIQ
jgi:hypothetical protein